MTSIKPNFFKINSFIHFHGLVVLKHLDQCDLYPCFLPGLTCAHLNFCHAWKSLIVALNTSRDRGWGNMHFFYHKLFLVSFSRWSFFKLWKHSITVAQFLFSFFFFLSQPGPSNAPCRDLHVSSGYNYWEEVFFVMHEMNITQMSRTPGE